MFLKQKHYDWIDKVFGSSPKPPKPETNDIDPERRMFLKVAGSTALIAVAAGSLLEEKVDAMPLYEAPMIQGVLRVRVIDEKFRVLYSEKCLNHKDIVWKRYHTDWYEYPGDGVVPNWWICIPVSEQTLVYVEGPDGSQKRIDVVFDEDGQPEPVIIRRYRSINERSNR